jgi:O-antigen ligase
MTNIRFYYFEIFAAILFLFLPAAMITGPFIPDFIISILAIYFFFIFLNNKVLYKNYFFICFISFYVLILVSTFFSNNFFISIQTTLPYLRFGLFVLTGFYLINKFPKIKIYFLNFLVFCFFILSIDGFCEFFTGRNILGYEYANGRISGLFGDELIIGSYVSRSLPIAVAIFFSMYAKIKFKFFYYFIFLFSALLIVMSGERTAFAILTIFLISILSFCNFKPILKFFAFFFFLLSFVLILFFSPSLKSRFIEETFSEIKGSNDLTAIHENIDGDNILSKELLSMREKSKNNQLFFLSTAHESAWRISLKMFQSSKLIGIGPKMFRYKCDKSFYKVYERGCSTHPHNFYAQMLAEVGIFGFLFLFILFLMASLLCFFNAFFLKKRIVSNYQVILICSYIAILFPLLPSGNFFNNWLSVTMYLPLTFLVSSFYE